MSYVCQEQHHAPECFDGSKGWKNGCAICEAEKAKSDTERLLTVINDLTVSLRTFRAVPKDEQEFVDTDEASLKAGFDILDEFGFPDKLSGGTEPAAPNQKALKQ